jgi:hypothetical protein
MDQTSGPWPFWPRDDLVQAQRNIGTKTVERSLGLFFKKERIVS